MDRKSFSQREGMIKNIKIGKRQMKPDQTCGNIIKNIGTLFQGDISTLHPVKDIRIPPSHFGLGAKYMGSILQRIVLIT